MVIMMHAMQLLILLMLLMFSVGANIFNNLPFPVAKSPNIGCRSNLIQILRLNSKFRRITYSRQREQVRFRSEDQMDSKEEVDPIVGGGRPFKNNLWPVLRTRIYSVLGRNWKNFHP